MRKLIYSEYIRRDADGNIFDNYKHGTTLKLEEKGEALFHQFGLDCAEDEIGGMASYSTAIIELLDGTIKNIPVDHIRFITPVDNKEQTE